MISMYEDIEILDQPQEPDKKGNCKKKLTIAIVSILVVVILALIAAIVVKEVVITTFIVDNISMYPTLDGGSGAQQDSDPRNGEKLILNKVAKFGRGDIVVFRPDWDMGTGANGMSKTLVKRIVAVGGDRVRILASDGSNPDILFSLYVNGEKVSEPYINGVWKDGAEGVYSYGTGSDYVVPYGCVFLMGDNRDHSTDCRVYGAVPADTVVGKCFLIKGLYGKYRKP